MVMLVCDILYKQVNPDKTDKLYVYAEMHYNTIPI